MTDSSAPEGWYPDRGRFRWWDGTQWIDRYLDEERADVSDDQHDAPSETVGALVICGELAVLGVAQLSWLGQGEEALGLAFISIGPTIGVVIGTRLSARRRKVRNPKPHSLAWNIVMSIAMILVFLLFITVINGGLIRDAIVPTAVLTLVGAAAFVVTMKRFYPGSFAVRHPTEESP